MRFGLGRARLAAVAVAVATCILGSALGGEASAGPKSPPNFLIIQTDDQGLDLFNEDAMPHTFQKIVGHGTVLSNYGVSTPLCCPSRAALLTGQYGHNNGVLRNGYELLNNKGQTLPVWLKQARYRTIHIGKYLNHYPQFAGAKPAPGWTNWQTLIDNNYYDYRFSDNGERVRYGDDAKDYVGRVLTQRAVATLKKKSDKPFFMDLDLEAPHADAGRGGSCSRDAIPDPREADDLIKAPLPDQPSFNEPDISDKPDFMQGLPILDSAVIHKVKRSYRCALTTMVGADRGINRILNALKRTGQLDDTMIVFISDNGVLRGQHRIPAGKAVAYRESVQVPAVIRMPAGFSAPSSLNPPTANIDLAPTILDLAGAEACREPGKCRTMDGRSMLGSLGGPGDPIPSDRTMLVELDKSHGPHLKSNENGHKGPCTYAGVRDSQWWYVRYTNVYDTEGNCQATDQREMYDLDDDGFQLANLYPPSPGNQAEATALAAKLATLEDCAGIAGRDAPVGGKPYCE
jgi:arylsulfatase A-like enzyme